MRDGLSGFYSFAKDRDGSGDLASAATTLAVHRGAHLLTTKKALCVWFVHQTIFLGVWVARLLSPVTEIERWIPGFYEFMKDHEGPGDLASAATPLVVHPGYVSQVHIMALCVWFVHRTIFFLVCMGGSYLEPNNRN